MKPTPILLLVAALAGCGGPANIAGDYSVNLTNNANGCNIQNWQSGGTFNSVDFNVTQSGGNTTGVIGGAFALFVDFALGGNATFNGTVSGDHFDMTLFGTAQHSQNGCSYTINAEITGSIAADFISGDVKYTTKTNGSPDCGSLEGCQSDQAFTGARPSKM
jgi:hypothetical protein